MNKLSWKETAMPAVLLVMLGTSMTMWSVTVLVVIMSMHQTSQEMYVAQVCSRAMLAKTGRMESHTREQYRHPGIAVILGWVCVRHHFVSSATFVDQPQARAWSHSQSTSNQYSLRMASATGRRHFRDSRSMSTASCTRKQHWRLQPSVVAWMLLLKYVKSMMSKQRSIVRCCWSFALHEVLDPSRLSIAWSQRGLWVIWRQPLPASSPSSSWSSSLWSVAPETWVYFSNNNQWDHCANGPVCSACFVVWYPFLPMVLPHCWWGHWPVPQWANVPGNSVGWPRVHCAWNCTWSMPASRYQDFNNLHAY